MTEHEVRANHEQQSVPAGSVSTIRGRWQAPILTRVAQAMFLLAVIGMIIPGSAATVLAAGVVAAAIAIPVLRVCWLVVRWWQERDLRFIAIGTVLLAVIAAGAIIALAS